MDEMKLPDWVAAIRLPNWVAAELNDMLARHDLLEAAKLSQRKLNSGAAITFLALIVLAGTSKALSDIVQASPAQGPLEIGGETAQLPAA